MLLESLNQRLVTRPFLLFSIEPSKIASIIPQVSLIEIRLPVLFQPVLTKYASAPLFCTLKHHSLQMVFQS